MKHLLEYEDAELMDLMGDLETVGQTKVYAGTLWARFPIYRFMNNRWTGNPEFVCFLKTRRIYGAGDEVKDKALLLKAIQNGDFDVPNDPDARSWSALRLGNEMAVNSMEKGEVQSLAKSCSTVDELIEGIRKNLVESQQYVLRGELDKPRYPSSKEAACNVLVYGFIAPVGSPYLVTSNLDKPFLKGNGINCIG